MNQEIHREELFPQLGGAARENGGRSRTLEGYLVGEERKERRTMEGPEVERTIFLEKKKSLER